MEKIVKPVEPSGPEKAQIAIEGGEKLYGEIRIENTLENAAGELIIEGRRFIMAQDQGIVSNEIRRENQLTWRLVLILC